MTFTRCIQTLLAEKNQFFKISSLLYNYVQIEESIIFFYSRNNTIFMNLFYVEDNSFGVYICLDAFRKLKKLVFASDSYVIKLMEVS